MRTGCQLGWNLPSKIHQNLLLDGSWAVLWPSWAVLGRLGGLLRRLEEASKIDAKKECTKSRQKMRLQASLANFGGVRPWAGTHALWTRSSVWTPKLQFTNYNTPLPLTIYHLPFTYTTATYHLPFTV